MMDPKVILFRSVMILVAYYLWVHKTNKLFIFSKLQGLKNSHFLTSCNLLTFKNIQPLFLSNLTIFRLFSASKFTGLERFSFVKPCDYMAVIFCVFDI
jgi:hypothetical protein